VTAALRRLAPPVAVAAILVAGAGGAAAHSGVAATSPRAGAVVPSLPSTIRITFTGLIGGVGPVTVRDTRGRNRVVAVRRNPRNASQLLVRTRGGGAGRFTVRWRIVAADGHPQSGTFAFRVRRR